MHSSEAPRGKPRGIFAEPCEAKNAIHPRAKARGILAKKGKTSATCGELLRIEGALYPDQDLPRALRSLADRVDFIARLCAAWDFGILPDARVVRTLARKNWRAAVDACGLLTSPAYHLLREWHGLPPQPFLGQTRPEIANDPNLAYV